MQTYGFAGLATVFHTMSCLHKSFLSLPRSPLTLKHRQKLPTLGHMVDDMSRVPRPGHPARCTLSCSRADFVLKELPVSFLHGVVLAELLKSVEAEGVQTSHPGF